MTGLPVLVCSLFLCPPLQTDIDSAIESYDLMSQRLFTHASPTLFNAGTPRPQLSSCFLLSVKEDSIEGIYDTLKQVFQQYSTTELCSTSTLVLVMHCALKQVRCVVLHWYYCRIWTNSLMFLVLHCYICLFSRHPPPLLVSPLFFSCNVRPSSTGTCHFLFVLLPPSLLILLCTTAAVVPHFSSGFFVQCASISKFAGGIGVSIHSIRATDSYVAGSNGSSNGLVPMLRVFNDTARYVDQVRGPALVPLSFLFLFGSSCSFFLSLLVVVLLVLHVSVFGCFLVSVFVKETLRRGVNLLSCRLSKTLDPSHVLSILRGWFVVLVVVVVSLASFLAPVIPSSTHVLPGYVFVARSSYGV